SSPIRHQRLKLVGPAERPAIPACVAPSRAANSSDRLRSTPARPRRRGSRCPRAENGRAEYARTLLEPPSPLSPHCVPGFIGRTHVLGLQPLIPEPCTSLIPGRVHASEFRPQ